MASKVEFVDSNCLDVNHLHSLAHSSYSKFEELAGDFVSKLQPSIQKMNRSFGSRQYAGTAPWPQLPVRNHHLTATAVVIIGGGISGKSHPLVHQRT